MTKNLNIADQLGIVRARIAELQQDEKALKAEIVAIGHAVDGELFRAVPITAERTTVFIFIVRKLDKAKPHALH